MLRTGLQAGLRAVSRKSNNAGAHRFMSKEIKFGVEGRNAMLVGVNTLADAVQVRLCEVFNFFRLTHPAVESHSRSQRIAVEKIPFLRDFIEAKGNLKIYSIIYDENSSVNFLNFFDKFGFAHQTKTFMYFCCC